MPSVRSCPACGGDGHTPRVIPASPQHRKEHPDEVSVLTGRQVCVVCKGHTVVEVRSAG